MSEIKLKPCPFCGGEATIKRYQKDDFVEFSVDCCNRGCVCSAHTYCYDNKEDAIYDWNTRKPMDNIVAELEEAKYTREEKFQYDTRTQEKMSSYNMGLNKAINTIKLGGM